MKYWKARDREQLREQAAHARRMAKAIPGDPAADALLELAEKLEAETLSGDGIASDLLFPAVTPSPRKRRVIH